MFAYVISQNDQAKPIVRGTLGEVRKTVRERIPKDSRDWARVTLEDFPDDKSAFIALKNGHEVAAKQVLRKWRLNPRGRLVEIPVEED